jgi:hypothetical protein
MELAGRIGWLEAQVDHLKALPAPELTETRVEAPPRNGTAETTVEPSEPKRNPWWRVW